MPIQRATPRPTPTPSISKPATSRSAYRWVAMTSGCATSAGIAPWRIRPTTIAAPPASTTASGQIPTLVLANAIGPPIIGESPRRRDAIRVLARPALEGGCDAGSAPAVLDDLDGAVRRVALDK